MGRKTKQNHITTPELLAQINPQNLKFTKEFLRYMKSMKRSPGTISGYEHDLQIFWVFLLNECDNKSILDCTIRDYVNFQGYLLEDNENSPARIRRIKASISSLSNAIELLYADEYPMFRNLVRKIESPVNEPVRTKTVLSKEQIDVLLDELVKRGDYEKACCFALAAYSGRRKAELFRFKVSDFDDAHIVYGTLYRSDPIQTKGRSGGKMLPCYTLKKQFDPYLNMWMEERQKKGIDSQWLFPDPADNSRQRNADIMNSWAKTASTILGVDVYPHALRHHMVSELRATGLPDEIIVNLIGWSEGSGSAMLSIYDDADTMDKFGDYFRDGEIVVDREEKSLGSL